MIHYHSIVKQKKNLGEKDLGHKFFMNPVDFVIKILEARINLIKFQH